jgi:hypothetical protein
MPELFVNDRTTTLAADITAAATTITVASSTGFPSPPAGSFFRVRIGDEFVRVTAISGTTWTVVRAQENTSAAAATTGAPVTHVVTAAALGALGFGPRVSWVNILDYGADPTNATSSRAALDAAIADLPSGGTVFFPVGTYNLGNTAYVINTAHIRLLGAARYNTVITTTSLTEDIIQIAQYYNVIETLSFRGPFTTAELPTRTAGFAINGAGGQWAAYSMVRDCAFSYQWSCVNLSNTLMELHDCEMRHYRRSGVVINQNSDHQVTNLTTDNNRTVNAPTGAGIEVIVCASLLLDRNNLINNNVALDIAPPSGVTVPSIKATNCFFDTSNFGLRMVTAGAWFRSQFTNCWFSSHSSNGIHIVPATGGQADGITFTNCDIYNNVAGSTNGVVMGVNVGKWKMTACNIAGWTNGMILNPGTNHWPTIIGCTIGAVSAFAGNGTGIQVAAGAYKGLMIAKCDVLDNTTNASIGALTVAAGTGGRFRIIDNTGINPRGAVTAPAIPASGGNAENTTGFRCTVIIRTGGTTAPTAWRINGVAWTAGNNPPITQNVEMVLEPGSTWGWTGTIAPTAQTWIAH